MNTSRHPDDHEPTAYEMLKDLHEKVRSAGRLAVQLMNHGDLTKDHLAEYHAGQTIRTESRNAWESLRTRLALLNIHLHPYDSLPFHDSPFDMKRTRVGALHTLRKPAEFIRARIRRAEETKQQKTTKHTKR